MSVRRYAAATVAVLLLAVPAVAGSSAATVASGSASSGLTLLDLSVAGHQVRVGEVVLTGDTTGSAPAAKVVVTPVTADGTSYGQQTVTPSSPATVPSVDSSSAAPALGRVAVVRSPAITAAASTADGASARVSTATLGALSVLGLPVQLDGQVSVGSAVDSLGATGEKTLTLRNVALPSIADLLGALGLDLTKLPPATLTSLVERLGLVTGTITTAEPALEVALAPLQSQLDAANKTVADAQAAVTRTTATLTDQQATLAAAQTTLAGATQQLQASLPALLRAQGLLDPVPSLLPSPSPVAVPTVSPLPTVPPAPLPTSSPLAVPVPLPTDAPSLPLVSPSPLPSIALPADLTPVTQALVDSYTTAKTAYDAALAAVNSTTTQLNTLTDVLNTASKTVNDLLAQVQNQVDALAAAVTARLDATPLVSLDSVTVRTRAAATSASAGGQAAEIVGGEVRGLHVLGTDVLANVLGTSSVDLLDLASGTLASVTSALNGVTATLSSVLSNVPALPTLSVPAPQVGLLTKTTSTSVSGGFGRASTSLRLLQITIPAITLPATVALPGASSLPAFGALRAQAVGDLVSTPISLSVGTLTDAVAFRPAATAAASAPGGSVPGASVPGGSVPGGSVPGGSVPGGSVPGGSVPGGSVPGGVPTSGAPQLPRTGLPSGLAVLALGLLAGAWGLRRSRAAA